MLSCFLFLTLKGAVENQCWPVISRPYADFLGELRQVEEIYEWVKAGYQAQMEAA